MALSIFMRGSRKLPVLNSATSKLMVTQLKNYNLLFTPVISKNFSGLNRQILDSKKYNGNNNQVIQARMISHSAIWTAEKAMSAGLLAIIPACVAFPNPFTDNLLAVTVVLHMHWGIEAVVVDYIRPSLVGNVIPQIARAIVYFMSAFTLGGLIYFNYNDVGCGKAIRRLWSIKAN
ncbi:Succinate dehydrogenase subunit D [Carabus blaptoides fortunei]